MKKPPPHKKADGGAKEPQSKVYIQYKGVAGVPERTLLWKWRQFRRAEAICIASPREKGI